MEVVVSSSVPRVNLLDCWGGGLEASEFLTAVTYYLLRSLETRNCQKEGRLWGVDPRKYGQLTGHEGTIGTV